MNRRKARKAFFKAPLHQRRKSLHVHLSKELREKLKKRTQLVKKGNRVKILVGKWKGVEGEVELVDLKSRKIYVKDITIKKTDGSKVLVPIDPSNVMLIKETIK
jgi:ribosomal protein uL24